MEQQDELPLRTVHVNGVPLRVPQEELPDPHPELAGGSCPWLDQATNAVCTVSGPHGTAHIAHDGCGQVIALWDEEHGYCPQDGNWRTRS